MAPSQSVVIREIRGSTKAALSRHRG